MLTMPDNLSSIKLYVLDPDPASACKKGLEEGSAAAGVS